MQYSIDDLVKVAKRDNNTKRPYLYVNPKQGKHLPADPTDFSLICKSLADKVEKQFHADRLYVIGFAETATGIASGVSHFLDNVVYYQNTTRECEGSSQYLYFTESHSHAVDQMLRTLGIGACINSIDRILIIDDEVTTGNTIQKLINTIIDEFGIKPSQFSIVSILNSMTSDRLEELKRIGIDCIYLSSLPFEYHKDQILSVKFDNSRHTIVYSDESHNIDTIKYDSFVNVRFISDYRKYENETIQFSSFVVDKLKKKFYKNALIIGTEEFMYPSFKLGEALIGNKVVENVKIHATTRSPIIASDIEGYPLFHRYQIRSLYDDDRITYIYNLEQYDKVFILTDASEGVVGINDLVKALNTVGNNDIVLIRWCYKS